MEIPMTVIARIRSDFPDKFGIPRQAGLVPELKARVVFEPEFRNPDLLRGLEGFSHVWLLWNFSGNQGWSPTVRPPRLGGNRRMGVFATRSPFRPNPIGLSCVRLEEVRLQSPEGPLLIVSGADLMDGTPIFDIKPYAPYADCHPDAAGGFTDTAGDFLLEVRFPPELLEQIPEDLREALTGVLSHDPRPSYQRDPERVYGLSFGGFNVRFRVAEKVLTVCQVETIK
ncbi:MAG: tRNA (N6-threonylcarbamoyladenosine(37)-N6)-methyltransferase TrmO [Faecousia sp.]